jgi:hypothetical protein
MLPYILLLLIGIARAQIPSYYYVNFHHRYLNSHVATWVTTIFLYNDDESAYLYLILKQGLFLSIFLSVYSKIETNSDKTVSFHTWTSGKPPHTIRGKKKKNRCSRDSHANHGLLRVPHPWPNFGSHRVLGEKDHLNFFLPFGLQTSSIKANNGAITRACVFICCKSTF